MRTLSSDQSTKLTDLGVSVTGMHVDTQEILAGMASSEVEILALQADSITLLKLLRDTASTSKEVVHGIYKVGDDVAVVNSKLVETRDGCGQIPLHLSDSFSVPSKGAKIY